MRTGHAVERGGTPGAVSRLYRSLIDAVRNVVRICDDWLFGAKRARYGLAVTRILLGVMIIGVVLTNFSTMRYTFGAGAAWTGQLEFPDSSFAGMFPFSLVNSLAQSDAGILAIMLGLLVCAVLFMLGYRTRLVMIPLFVLWVGFLSINAYVQDQSDNLTRISFLALFFTALSDRWSLDALRRKKYANRGGGAILRLWRYQRVFPSWFSTLNHNLAVVVLICQLCFVYASGGLFKAGGEPWQNGTAVYDPIQTARFGTWPELSDLVTFWGPGVAILTIGTVLVQVSFPFLMIHRFTRIFGLAAILFFHLGIALLMGLPWFSLSMIALDSIFVRDETWKKIGAILRSLIPAGATAAVGRFVRRAVEETPAETTTPSLPEPEKVPAPVAGH